MGSNLGWRGRNTTDSKLGLGRSATRETSPEFPPKAFSLQENPARAAVRQIGRRARGGNLGRCPRPVEKMAIPSDSSRNPAIPHMPLGH